MRELSLHILDIAKNATQAGASLVEIIIDEDILHNNLTISIKDNGKGMSEDLLKRVKDPFATTRTTRNVGLGIPFFEMAAKLSGGGLEIDSAPNQGTCVKAWFVYDHIDRQPLGDMPSTIMTIVAGSPEADFVYRHIIDGKEFSLDTREMKRFLNGVSVDNVEVAAWLIEYVTEGLNMLRR